MTLRDRVILGAMLGVTLASFALGVAIWATS